MFDLASKYSFSLDKNREKAIKCLLLLYYLESYVNGAIIEMRRLNRTRQVIKKGIQKSLETRGRRKNFHLTYLAKDTHFYFICIDKVYKLLSSLSDELNDSDIKNLETKLNSIFDIKTVRGHLEHIEQRCLGRFPREDKSTIAKNDLGNFIGEDFSFGGKKFPSGVGSVNELKKIYTDLLEILESKYASQDPSFVWRQQSEERYKQIMQKLKKMGLFQS